MTQTIALAFLLVSAASAEGSTPSMRDNAALQYWQAFALMPTRDSLSAGDQKALKEWRTVPLDAATTRLVHKFDEPMAYVRRGATCQFCDWGLGPALRDDGPGASSTVGFTVAD